MRDRFLASPGMLTALIGVAALAGVSVGGQSPAARATTTDGAKQWTPPHTAWGEPDLQGKWSYATITPLERPGDQAGKSVLSAEEVTALDEDARTSADRRDGAPEADLARAYNAYWYDRGKSIGRTSLIVDPPDGRLPPVTPEGRMRQAAIARQQVGHEYDSWEDRPLQERCIIYHGVPPLPSGYNNTYQIFQTPGYVAILDENIHDVRGIPLDGRPHLDRKIRQWNGNSVGRWENNTLVVETTNYSPQTTFRFPVASETLRAVERFTRVAKDRMDYRFTIEDPATYERPWTAMLPMTNLPDYVIFEYACHEGNYSIKNVLSGARTQERAQQPASASTASASLNYDVFKTRVQPILLAKRPGHARCIACHASGTPLRLQPLSPGSATWSDEESRKNFEAVKRVALPGNLKSPLLVHPLAEEAGGDFFHSGGKHWSSQSEPEWQTLKAFVLGQPTN